MRVKLKEVTVLSLDNEVSTSVVQLEHLEVFASRTIAKTVAKMLAMSTLMMPAATMTTMTNAGPIPVAAPTKLEPAKLLQLTHPALMQQQMQSMPQQHQQPPQMQGNSKIGESLAGLNFNGGCNEGFSERRRI